MNFEEIMKTVTSWCMNTGIKVVIALVVLVIAFKVINVLAKKLNKKNNETQKLDKTVTRSLISIGRILLKVLVVLCLINYLGIDTSGITALIASLGVCAGLAVNGALSNLAGGVLLLVTRPFRVDDYIEVAGYSGTVEEINICSTKLITVDNKVIYVPNGTASTATITNFSEKKLRRVDLTYTIPYGTEFAKARALIQSVAENHELVLKDPTIMVRVSGANDCGNEIVCRTWVNAADYWTVYFDLLESTKNILEENGYPAPAAQMEVHLSK